MVNLGFWQLRRLDDKRDRNALIEARSEQPVTPVGELLDPGDGEAAVDGARYRAVTATGTYDAPTTVTVRNRTQEGVPGAWLVTPLRLAEGERVGVIRGFVSLTSDSSVADVPPPTGEVTVTGLVVDPDGLDGTAPRDVAPRLRGAVVHLLDDRRRRLSAGPAPRGGAAGQGGRRPRRPAGYCCQRSRATWYLTADRTVLRTLPP